MSGPMGGTSGAVRIVGKGQRRLMTKGMKLGSYVHVSYRVPIKQEIDENDTGQYKGKIVDKRIGGQDRESWIELKEVLKVDEDGNVLAKEKNKRLIDAFIEECKVIEKPTESFDEIKTVADQEAAEAAETAAEEGEGGMMMPGMMNPGMMMMQNMMQGMMAANMMQNMMGMGGADPWGAAAVVACLAEAVACPVEAAVACPVEAAVEVA
eukprot:CAMPEP_0197633070 /NCGR_PEP_ID=MMETSP1338-20131121/9517_1 /TAXON_ID=43686 ORGANISM="Pelagodinium beii, Strain RCC1491" /NCGR_SAMPLE_ID=MMETSP1338 /ASSEMBLY_ACC=CAM_ASM_000754 /LENGTH=208 /DNA_ID=CAMNT_0043204659 /DNA_START=49 /DNA_END=672 /DNA_ORIENTATION=-